ncbi:hypothetical protein GCM10026982_01550 [Nocardiopsis aegyptia]
MTDTFSKLAGANSDLFGMTDSISKLAGANSDLFWARTVPVVSPDSPSLASVQGIKGRRKGEIALSSAQVANASLATFGPLSPELKRRLVGDFAFALAFSSCMGPAAILVTNPDPLVASLLAFFSLVTGWNVITVARRAREIALWIYDKFN